MTPDHEPRRFAALGVVLALGVACQYGGAPAVQARPGPVGLFASDLPHDLGSRPLYTDAEAEAFRARSDQLYGQIDACEAERPESLRAHLMVLEIDYRCLRAAGWRPGGATTWFDYRLSSGYRLTASYHDMPQDRRFAGVRITKAHH